MLGSDQLGAGSVGNGLEVLVGSKVSMILQCALQQKYRVQGLPQQESRCCHCTWHFQSHMWKLSGFGPLVYETEAPMNTYGHDYKVVESNP